MNSLSPFLYVPLVVLLSVATLVDMHTRRIPNWITLSGLFVGIAVWIWLEGGAGLIHALLGMLVGLAVFFPIYLARGMGAGDVKLMAAAGSFLGPGHAFFASLLVALVGGVIAAIYAWYYGRLGEALHGSLALLFKRSSRKTLANSARTEAIPYGLAISLGTVMYLLVMNYT